MSTMDGTSNTFCKILNFIVNENNCFENYTNLNLINIVEKNKNFLSKIHVLRLSKKRKFNKGLHISFENFEFIAVIKVYRNFQYTFKMITLYYVSVLRNRKRASHNENNKKKG